MILSSLKITHLIHIQSYLLAIFQTNNTQSWQYSILLPDLTIFSPPDTFFNQNAAEYAGRYIIQNLLLV